MATAAITQTNFATAAQAAAAAGSTGGATGGSAAGGSGGASSGGAAGGAAGGAGGGIGATTLVIVGATATTDGAGNFDLTTTLPRSRIDECLTYTITITAAGLPTYTVSTRGFSGNQRKAANIDRSFLYHRRRRPSWAAARTKR